MKRKSIGIALGIVIFGAVPVTYAATDSLKIIIHGKTVSSKETVKLIEGKTLVPLRIIAEHIGQEVQWDSSTNTVTVEEKPITQLEKILIQRQTDDFEIIKFSKVEEAFNNDLNSLYNLAYRGLLTDLENDSFVLTSTQVESLYLNNKNKLDLSSEKLIRVRFIRSPYIPGVGENAPAVKDLMFFINEKEPEDLLIGAQNPRDLDEWRVYKVKDYGKWFEKEIEIYIRTTSGL